jgi:hypothetical protein
MIEAGMTTADAETELARIALALRSLASQIDELDDERNALETRERLLRRWTVAALKTRVRELDLQVIPF